ncbi:MAG: hypothetical protein Q7S14_02225 [bacterium]|nr:hypothetical protein [bacterium]
MAKRPIRGNEAITGSLPKQVIVLFILASFSIWALMVYMYFVEYLQQNYINAAVEGLNFLMGLALIAVTTGHLAKMFRNINIIKLYNFALIISVTHLALDILHFPNLNWLNKNKI